MLRAATASLARRAILKSSRGAPACAAPRLTFHASARREEEAKEVAPYSKGGIFGTGVNEWYALPVGIAFAVPALHYEWFIINEELQLAACFIMFLVACYTNGGDAVYNYLNNEGEELLKEHNQAEDELIAAYKEKLDVLKMNAGMVKEFEAINALREEAYANLNKAGAIQPTHEFKTQMERALNMIVQEEASVADKAKHALMAEAMASVSAKFASSKELQKDALDLAIAKLKGSGGKEDPVLKSYKEFFQAKAAAAKKADDGSEEKAQRDALVAKLNAVSKSEGFYFQFDEKGVPKMAA